MANEFVGSSLYATWVYSGGTIVLTGDSRTHSFTPTINFIDATAGADAAIVRLASLADSTCTFETLALSGTAGTATLTALKEGTSGTLTFGEAGTATGSPKTIMPAFSQGVTRTTPYDNVATWGLSFLGNGTVTYTTW